MIECRHCGQLQMGDPCPSCELKKVKKERDEARARLAAQQEVMEEYIAKEARDKDRIEKLTAQRDRARDEAVLWDQQLSAQAPVIEAARRQHEAATASGVSDAAMERLGDKAVALGLGDWLSSTCDTEDAIRKLDGKE